MRINIASAGGVSSCAWKGPERNDHNPTGPHPCLRFHIAAISASTSSEVLYSTRDARTVLSKLRR